MEREILWGQIGEEWSHTLLFNTQSSIFLFFININAIAVNFLENGRGCIIDGDKRGPHITCYAGRWLNTTVWTQINLTEWRGNDGGTETWRVVWIGPNTYSRHSAGDSEESGSSCARQAVHRPRFERRLFRRWSSNTKRRVATCGYFVQNWMQETGYNFE